MSPISWYISVCCGWGLGSGRTEQATSFQNLLGGAVWTCSLSLTAPAPSGNYCSSLRSVQSRGWERLRSQGLVRVPLSLGGWVWVQHHRLRGPCGSTACFQKAAVASAQAHSTLCWWLCLLALWFPTFQVYKFTGHMISHKYRRLIHKSEHLFQGGVLNPWTVSASLLR